MDNELGHITREITTMRDRRLPADPTLPDRRRQRLQELVRDRAEAPDHARSFIARLIGRVPEIPAFAIDLRLATAAACLALVGGFCAPRMWVRSSSDSSARVPAGRPANTGLEAEQLIRLRLTTADLMKLETSLLAQGAVQRRALDELTLVQLDGGMRDPLFTSAIDPIP